MKILHTADWHLGKKLENFSRLEEQVLVLDEICSIADAEGVDAVVIAGDLFDNFNPQVQAVELFYKTLKRLSSNGKRLVIAVSGNHDSPERIESPDPLARECGIILTGYLSSVVSPFEIDTGLKILRSDEGFIEVLLPGIGYPLRLILTPYANEKRVKKFLGVEDTEQELRKVIQDRWEQLSKKYLDDKGVNILVSHLFMIKKGETNLDEPEDEKPILHVGGLQTIYTESIPKEVQYVALGHLHSKIEVSKTPCPVFYSSSILSYSMGDKSIDKYVLIVDIKPGEKAEIKPVKLNNGKKLIRKTFDSVLECVEFLKNNPNILIEITIITEEFLETSDRKLIMLAHDGIVAIIPQIQDTEVITNTVSLNKDIKSLFKDYFKYKTKVAPNTEIMALFNEVLSK